MGKRGVLLINVGTPDQPSIESVRDYLKEFLLDPDVIDAPYLIRQFLVKGIILRFRPKKIAPKYQSIWMNEGSPLRVYTQRIADALQNVLRLPCKVGMRYGNPSIESALDSLRNEGVDELLIAPLFPHYAQATTETSFKHTYKQLKIIDWNPEVYHLDSFPVNPHYINPLSESIKPHLNKDTHLLFSFHGLPLSHIRRAKKLGIPNYAEHCEQTTHSVVESLKLEKSQWSLSFQSRLGPVKWLKPSTDQMVLDLAKKGIKKLVIVSPAFLADGLETLEELDIEIREIFVENGGEELKVVRCLNDNEDWIKGLSEIVSDAFISKPLQGF
ncbi:MAG: ferrochelatase [Euryarchaeota archaeon]|nr:ferrochelatase [Euryarchaeota archaeon]